MEWHGRYSTVPDADVNPFRACRRIQRMTLPLLYTQLMMWFSVEKQGSSHSFFISFSCRFSNLGLPTVPQSYVAEYIGKQGASVPSTRMINVFCPARHPQGSTAPRMSCFICARRSFWFTTL